MEKTKKSESKMTKRLTFDVAEELHRKLKVLAAETGKSMAELVTQAVEQLVKKPK